MKYVLVVDDSATIREQVRIAFDGKSDVYTIVEAENGVEALDVLKDNDKFNLIISDVNMPEMDGITMVEHISKDDGLKHIPIIMLTTEVSADLKSKAKDCGVKAWMVKPFTADKILLAADKISI